MDKFEDAVIFATQLHKGQKRKINGIPFIMHPIEVATIISSITTDTDVMIAGVLHDSIEDGGADPEEIERRFGPKVRELVMSETEKEYANLSKASSWQIRKQESLYYLKTSSDINVKILWLSDKLANIRSLYVGYLKMGDDVFTFFNQKDKSKHKWYYETILSYVSELKGTAAYMEYESLVKKVFE